MGSNRKRFKKSHNERSIDIIDFKSSFKYFKSKNPPPDMNQVIDADNEKFQHLFSSCASESSNYFEEESHNPHLCKNIQDWKLLKLNSNPGIKLIKDVFSEENQTYWSERCIKDFSSSEFKRNIDNPTLNINIKDWYEEVKADGSLVDKLRWSTLGYHHDWDSKVYSETNRGEFPGDLADLSRRISSVIGYSNYKAEAAIVNYYPLSGNLSGHTDHSEHNLAAPLISISLGLPAIFLIGDKTLDTVPCPLLLRSGDVLVMEKEARLSYHAVPRILPYPEDINFSSDHDQFLQEYLSTHRINMNIRQVNG